MNTSTLVELAIQAASTDPERILYTFLSERGEEAETLTAGRLHVRAKAIAVQLGAMGGPGERVLVVCNPGLECITAFFGCLYAGMIAVPVPPARKNTDARTWNAAKDSGATIALGMHDSQIAELAKTIQRRFQGFKVSGVSDEVGNSWQAPEARSDSVAFLQYTSGSTGAPKGVIVSHHSLLQNAAGMHATFELSSTDRTMLWLPLHHDMGLIGGVIQTVYSGYTTFFISPSSFMNRPLRWLELISEYRATVSGGPNFAYELCVRLAARNSCPTLDLSSWRVAFNGAETVRSGTLKRFTEAFESCGFRSSAFRPCYGLAEATLLVSSVRPGMERILTVDKESLRQGLAQEMAHDDASAVELVSVGSSTSQEIVIVEPDNRRIQPENHVGEIWVSGPCVTEGYWERPLETENSFRAQIAGSSGGPYLRTGDLGFIRNGSLCITGRLKDLIIVRGRNYYPQDIEATVEATDLAFRPNCGAAFAIETETNEQLVVVHELDRKSLKNDLTQLFERVRQNIAEQHELSPHCIVFVRPGTLPKTSSGKIRRQACRDAYLAGQLDVVKANQLDDASLEECQTIVQRSGASGHFLLERIRRQLAKQLGREIDESNLRIPLSALGLDSMAILELRLTIEQATGKLVPVSQLLSVTTIADICEWLESGSNTDPDLSTPDSVPLTHPITEFPLSAGQRALWFLQQLEPGSPALAIVRLFRIHGPLAPQVLRAAFNALLARHPILTMKVRVRNGEPHQQVDLQSEISMEQFDSQLWSESFLTEHIQEQAKKPFDLANGSVLRLYLYTRSSCESLLLFCVHHIAVDLWSLRLMAQDLSVLYNKACTGHGDLEKIPNLYSDYVQWQRSLLASRAGEEIWEHWHRLLHDSPPRLQLTRGCQSAGGGTRVHRFQVLPPVVQSLKSLAQKNEATLNMVMLAAFGILLYRYSGQCEFLMGVLSSGRTRASWKSVVGYFVNPLILRLLITGSTSFEQHLGEVRKQLLLAIDYADYPFATLVERLRPERNPRKAPLLQVLCVLQPSGAAEAGYLSPIAEGLGGGTFPIGDLEFSSQNIDSDDSQFELVFATTNSGETIEASFRYSCDLFDAGFIEGMASDLNTLLQAIVDAPRKIIDFLPLLDRERTQAVLQACSSGEAVAVEEICIHEAIARQARQTPGNPAVVDQSGALGYAELESKANLLARCLIELGCGPETCVGVLFERSIELVIALLAVLKAGAAYVPLDPGQPEERIRNIIENSGMILVVSSAAFKDQLRRIPSVRIFCLDAEAERISSANKESVRGNRGAGADALAYVMYTSGSTGKPKGVMVSHRNVMNFFRGMNDAVPCGPKDTLLAVTNVAFDISVLELLWTLTRGCRVVVASDQWRSGQLRSRGPRHRERLHFSLFYFASADATNDQNRYRLLLEGAKLADQFGFDAVWTPERHFHAFGGLYPNPSLTSAALATITNRVHLRAGSVVLPLQNPLRVAEEWALVDNLSNGRIGIAFASGWHANDFVFFPQHYDRRRQIMLENLHLVRRLWRGESVRMKGPGNDEVEVSTYPRPIQAELPVWITSGGTAETFALAGHNHANILTHLLGQDIADVAKSIGVYREALQTAGGDSSRAIVTLMLHTYLDDTEEEVRAKALKPFKRYLDSSVGLMTTLIKTLKLDVDVERMTAQDKDDLLTFASERYMGSSGLFGTERNCLEMLEQLVAIGVNEIACLVDFGVEVDSVIRSIHRINRLKERLEATHAPSATYNSLAEQALRHHVTMMQCTPSLFRSVSHDDGMREALGSMHTIMLGGEPVPPSVVKSMADAGVGQILNMYGPTETTIWSAVSKLKAIDEQTYVGGPIANTQIYVLSNCLMLVPFGVTGEVYIGGSGLARGYLGDPCQTSERFVPDPFSRVPGSRLYRTGDLGRIRHDRKLELLGRSDQQVKIRGYRVELGEIEAILNAAPGVESGVVMKASDGQGEDRLVAFVKPTHESTADTAALREFLKIRLPQYMVPTAFHVIQDLPVTRNGKIDRQALRVPKYTSPAQPRNTAPPKTNLELQIAAIWKEVLRVDSVGVDENFFDIGGHSLLLVQVHQKAQEVLAQNFPLIQMLEHPTIRSFASHLGAAGRQEARPEERAFKQKSALKSQRDRNLAVREGVR